MADIRRSAPQVGLSLSSSVMPPNTSTVPVADAINAAADFERGFSLGRVERQLVDTARDAKDPSSFEDNSEWKEIQGKWDRKLLQLKQQRRRPFQINNKIEEKARELAMEHPRFKADIFKLAKGLGTDEQVSPPSEMEKMIEDAQAKAAFLGMSTDAYIHMAGMKEREEMALGMREVRIKQRNISAAELLDVQRENIDTRQRALVMDLSAQVESGQNIDANVFASQVDQVVNAELMDWAEAAQRATGFRPSSQEMDKARQEFEDQFSWIKDMATSRDSAKLAARAKQFMNDSFEVEINKAMPVFMAARQLVGTENVFSLMDMLSKVSSDAQRQALIKANPVFGALSSQQFRDASGAAIAKAFGIPSPYQLTPQQDEAAEIVADQIRKESVEKESVAKKRKRVFQSLIEKGQPVKMLSMYGSNEAHRMASENKEEIEWFKKEWARQTEANLNILMEAKDLGVSFNINPTKSISGRNFGGIEFDETNKPTGANLQNFMRNHAKYQQAVQNLNRLGGYLGNGWDTQFQDSGLTRDNVFESFIQALEVPGQTEERQDSREAPDQEGSDLLSQAQLLKQQSPDATIDDLIQFLGQSQNA